MDNLKGRTAIITGAASGIGQGTAVALAKRGVNVIVADIDEAGGAETCRMVEQAGAEAVFTLCDVAEPDAFIKLKDLALTRFGRVDIVMNNVGVICRAFPDHMPMEEWRRTIDINLMSIVRSNEVFLPLMIAQKDGHLVNTASFAGLFTYAFDRLPYATTKAAVVQMSEGLAFYLRPLGVGVTVLCPGPVVTNIGRSIRSVGPPVALRTPGARFLPLTSEVVGEQVAEAIETNRFMLPTHAEVFELLTERARDWDGFLQRQIDAPAAVAAGPR